MNRNQNHCDDNEDGEGRGMIMIMKGNIMTCFVGRSVSATRSYTFDDGDNADAVVRDHEGNKDCTDGYGG